MVSGKEIICLFINRYSFRRHQMPSLSVGIVEDKGDNFYKDVLNFEIFLREKTIGQEGANLITLVRTKEELLNHLYKIIDEG